MAIPTGDVLRVKTGKLAAFDDHVFEHFVQCMADMQFAVGVRRAVMQHKQRLAVACHAQLFVQALLGPALGPSGFALGQIAAHRKRRVGQVQGGAVIGGVRFGHVNSGSMYVIG